MGSLVALARADSEPMWKRVEGNDCAPVTGRRPEAAGVNISTEY